MIHLQALIQAKQKGQIETKPQSEVEGKK